MFYLCRREYSITYNFTSRNNFDHNDDEYLMKYIAKYNPGSEGRSGNVLYRTLEENKSGLWPWAKYHTWQSWRERYINNKDKFDAKIRAYQKKHRIEVPEPRSIRHSHPVDIEGNQQRHNAARKTTRLSNDLTPPRASALSPLPDTSSDEDRLSEDDQDLTGVAVKRKLNASNSGYERMKKRRTSERAVQYEEERYEGINFTLLTRKSLRVNLGVNRQ